MPLLNFKERWKCLPIVFGSSFNTGFYNFNKELNFPRTVRAHYF